MLFRVTAVLIPVAGATKFADFNGDGRSDILWRNSVTGENYLYPMNGTTILAGEGYLRTVADLNWIVAGIGDFDGDGKADILWRNSSTGENYVYLMNGTTITGEGYLRTVADQNWRVAGVGDFDGDGKTDILWRNSLSGENYVYFMDGMTIKPTEGYIRTVPDQNWRVAGTGDFDGDGKADILWRNSATGENYLYPMNGLAILPAEGYLRTVADQAWKIVGTGDFNADGRADILWRNSSTGENYLYPMNGTAILGTEGYLRTVADQNWKVQATGDYDGDGKADVLWHHSTSGENYLYFMDGTTIKSTEGYLRTVADQNWKVAGGVLPALTTNIPQFACTLGARGVSAYRINATTGALTAVSGSPFAAGTDPSDFSVDPSGKFAYVANQNSNNISAYSINPTTGVLTAVAGSPFSVGTRPLGVRIDLSGRFAYVVNSESHTISAFSIDTSTGALAPVAGSPFAAGFGPGPYLVIDPSGKFAYVANAGSNDISAYGINATTGALAPVAGSPFAAGSLPWDLAIHSSGKFAYVANWTSNNTSAYGINASTGALEPIAGSPFAAGSAPSGFRVDPSGKFAYVANYFSNNISAYGISATTGALTAVAGSPFSTGTAPVFVTFHPSGKFAYSGGGLSDSIAYNIDSTTGALTTIAGSPFAAGPVVVVEPSGKFAYVPGIGNISAFSIDAATGAFTPVAGSPFAGGGTGPWFYGSAP